MQTVPEGKHLGKILNYWLDISKNQNTVIKIQFKVEGFEWPAVWTGTFAEGKATEIAIDALQMLGFNEAKYKVSDLSKGVESGALNNIDDIAITVIHKESNGKVYANVSYIGQGGGAVSKLSPEEAKKSLPKGLESLMKARRKETGAKVSDLDDELNF
jgi:hypothetical protein